MILLIHYASVNTELYFKKSFWVILFFFTTFLSFSNTEMDEDVELESAMLSITPSKLQVQCKYNFFLYFTACYKFCIFRFVFSQMFLMFCVLPPAPPSSSTAAKPGRSMETEKGFYALGSALEHSSVEL